MSDRSIVQGWLPGDKRPYVYGLFYPASMGGSCFYVGKGTGRRVFYHRYEARSEKPVNTYKCRIIRKLWSIGEEYQSVIFAYHPTEGEAFLHETALVFLFGDCLTNLTFGGQGRAIRSEETRRKVSDGNKRRVVSEETRRKLSIASKGRKLSEDHCRKISEANKRRPPISEETRLKQREANKRSEETRRKISEANGSRSEETRRKISEAHKGLVSPMKGKTHSEETRRKMSETHSKRAIARRAK